VDRFGKTAQDYFELDCEEKDESAHLGLWLLREILKERKACAVRQKLKGDHRGTLPIRIDNARRAIELQPATRDLYYKIKWYANEISQPDEVYFWKWIVDHEFGPADLVYKKTNVKDNTGRDIEKEFDQDIAQYEAHRSGICKNLDRLLPYAIGAFFADSMARSMRRHIRMNNL